MERCGLDLDLLVLNSQGLPGKGGRLPGKGGCSREEKVCNRESVAAQVLLQPKCCWSRKVARRKLESYLTYYYYYFPVIKQQLYPLEEMGKIWLHIRVFGRWPVFFFFMKGCFFDARIKFDTCDL